MTFTTTPRLPTGPSHAPGTASLVVGAAGPTRGQPSVPPTPLTAGNAINDEDPVSGRHHQPVSCYWSSWSDVAGTSGRMPWCAQSSGSVGPFRPSRSTALASRTSLRMTAVMAILGAFPLSISCRYLRLRSALNRMATRAGMKIAARSVARPPRIISFPFHLPERRVNGASPARLAACFGARGPVALRQPLAALLPVVSAGLGADLQLHQPLGSKADHFAQQVRISALLHQSAEVHHGFGHRGHPSVQVGCRNPILPRNPMTTAPPPARYGA